MILLEIKNKEDFKTDKEFINYMKKRRIQISNLKWRIGNGQKNIIITC
jgi:hypothetical protein